MYKGGKKKKVTVPGQDVLNREIFTAVGVMKRNGKNHKETELAIEMLLYKLTKKICGVFFP